MHFLLHLFKFLLPEGDQSVYLEKIIRKLDLLSLT